MEWKKLQKKVGELIAEQIDSTQVTKKIYCGDKNNLPPEYTDFGSRRDCLKKGVGVGLHITPHVLTTDDIIKLLQILKISQHEFKNIKNRSKILKIIKRKLISL